MGKLTLRQAAEWCGGAVEEKYADVEFLGAANDTRVMQPGQLFIALQGARDGHDFIKKAMDRGAAAALCSRKVGDYPAIYVDDPRIALGRIAREELKRIGAKVVAVTGSVGKSTTKEMVAAVLEQAFFTSKTPANHNNDIGMPMAVLAMPENTEVAVLEMGMNHFGEIAYLSQIARPDVAVIINIGTAHIEFLGTQEGIRQAKMEIVEGMTPHGMLLLNGDDFLLRNLDKEPQQRVTYFGSSEGCAVRAFDVNQDGDYLHFRVEAGRLSFPVKMLLEGEHYVNDALAAVTVGLKLGVLPEKIQAGLSQFRNISGRQEIIQAGGMTIIKDCYNAGPESMAAALASGKVARYVTDFPNGKTANMPGCIAIPHLGASTEESEDNCAKMAVQELMDYLENGNIKNSVNYPNCDMGICRAEGRITLLHRNIPNSLGRFTAAIAGENINIDGLMNKSRGEYAYTMLDLDRHPSADVVEHLKQIDGVLKVRVIK